MTKSTTNGRSQKPNAKSNVTSIGAARPPKSVGAEATGAEQSAEGEPALIVFGLDEAGKAHASWFGEADAELATKAAGQTGYQVLPVTTPEALAQARALPAGRIFGSGKGFVPFCKMAAHEALKGFGEAFFPPPPEPTSPLVATSIPQTWDDVGVGALVLATTEKPSDGWFESVVVEENGDEGLFVLRWRDWPEDEPFVRRTDGLALLPVQKTEVSAPSQSGT